MSMYIQFLAYIVNYECSPKIDCFVRTMFTGILARSPGAKISGGKGRPSANILIPLERQLIALQPCC